MRTKRLFCLLLACVLSVSCLGTSAEAIGVTDLEVGSAAVYATGRFNMDIPGGTIVKASTSFPLEAGETVTIKALYSPSPASVDFGLIDSEGRFHYFNVSNGNFDGTIKIEERGNYTLAVRNNSSSTINVSGYVNY